MKIKFLTCLAGGNYRHKPGDIVHFDDADPKAAAEAQRHVKSGNARALDDVETAMESARETAMLARQKKVVTPPAKTAPAPAADPAVAAKAK